jgi:serine protease Do
VVDLDLSADTALLRLRQDLRGHRFTIAPDAPDLGIDVGVLGYPFGVDDVRLSRGAVSSGDTEVSYEGEDGFRVDHVVTTDAAINGGNSGGPAINRDGEVVGLVSGNSNWSGDPNEPVPAQGNNFLVPSDVVQDRYEDWADERRTETTDCDADDEAPVAADFDLDVAVDADSDDADDIALALYLHGDSINQGLYDAAWSLFTPRLQGRFAGVDGWAAGLSSSYWTRLDVREVDRDGRTAAARVALRTRQNSADGFQGQTCSDWSMRYRLVLVGGAWLIDDADAGAGPDPC